MKVIAKTIGDKKYVGFYNMVRRKPGDVFTLTDPKHFSETWMREVGKDTPTTPAPGEPPEDLVVRERKGKGKATGDQNVI